MALPTPGFLTTTTKGAFEEVGVEHSNVPRQCLPTIPGGSDEEHRRHEAACRREFLGLPTKEESSGSKVESRQLVHSASEDTLESAGSGVQSRHDDEMLDGVNQALGN